MRALVLTVNAPIARYGGAALRNQEVVRALGQLGEVDVVTLGEGSDAPLAGVQHHLGWSREELTRHRSLADQVQARAWRVLPRGHWRLNHNRSARALRAVRELVSTREHHLVVASQWPIAEYAIAVAPGRRLVFDTHNVEADLQGEIAGAEGSRTLATRLALRRLIAWERRLGERSDEVWVCSEQDAERWTAVHGRSTPVRVIPNTVRTDQSDPARRVRRDPHRVLFTGVLSYRPNADAACELARSVLPAIRTIVPTATLEIVGRHPTDDVIGLHAPDQGVIVCGEVPEIQPHLQGAAVLVVPLRVGGGTRLKILEAMAAGLPVVSTAKGAEGLGAENGVHLLLAESAEQLAEAAARVMTDVALASALAHAGRALVDERFSGRALDRHVATAAAELGLR